MAISNGITVGALHQSEGVGEVKSIPIENVDAAALVLRALIAFAEEDDGDIDVLIREGEAYEVMQNRLRGFKRNLVEIACAAEEVFHGRS